MTPFQVANHKMAGSVGNVPIFLLEGDLELLNRYAQERRLKIFPMAADVQEVFTTSTGAGITVDTQPHEQNYNIGTGRISKQHLRGAGRLQELLLLLFLFYYFI